MMKFNRLSWGKFYRDCLLLGKNIAQSNEKFDRIIAISRGGLIPARILSDFLKLPISNIVISSYANLRQQKEPEIVETSNANFSNQALLIVDEVSDSGKTFHHALCHYKNTKAKKILTASPYIKPKTTFIPDFWVKNINAWIVFPYDLHETYDAFVKQFASSKKAIEKMRKIGFSQFELKLLKSS